VAEEEQKEAAAAAQSSIFGGAKPVDTTKREKEIEEKLKKPHPVESRLTEKSSLKILLSQPEFYTYTYSWLKRVIFLCHF
jgi:hypothetical protein